MEFFVVFTVRRSGRLVNRSMILFALTAEEARRAFELQEQPFIVDFVEIVEITPVVEAGW